MARPEILALIAGNSPVATLGVTAYDGSTKVKRDGTKKVMLFSSGKKGFYAGGKVTIDGIEYQASCSFAEITRNQALNGMVKTFSAEQIAEMNRQRQNNEADRDDEAVSRAKVVSDEELERLTAPNQE